MRYHLYPLTVPPKALSVHHQVYVIEIDAHEALQEHANRDKVPSDTLEVLLSYTLHLDTVPATKLDGALSHCDPMFTLTIPFRDKLPIALLTCTLSAKRNNRPGGFQEILSDTHFFTPCHRDVEFHITRPSSEGGRDKDGKEADDVDEDDDEIDDVEEADDEEADAVEDEEEEAEEEEDEEANVVEDEEANVEEDEEAEEAAVVEADTEEADGTLGVRDVDTIHVDTTESHEVSVDGWESVSANEPDVVPPSNTDTAFETQVMARAYDNDNDNATRTCTGGVSAAHVLSSAGRP
jgi:hypothetical protein